MRISDWSSDVCSSDLWWSGKQYDKDIDREVRVLRHAQSIDEDRKTFPRVGWGIPADVTWNEDRGRCDWLRQWWFAGNHSDVGGSYPESESRLSDIALRWMADELKEALGDHVHIVEERLFTSPDPSSEERRVGKGCVRPGR